MDLLSIFNQGQIKLPKRIIFIAIGFMLAPVASTLFSKLFLNQPWANVLGMYSTFGWVLIFCAPVVGLAILRVKKSSWYLFIAYAVAVVVQNIILLIGQSMAYTWSLLSMSLVMLLLVAYFLQKDLSAPYFADDPRGFRRRKRKAIRKKIKVGDADLYSIDISRTGMALEWPDCPHSVGETVHIKLHSTGQDFIGEIMRIENDRVGVALYKEV